MGNFEKLVVLTVLFLVAIVLGVSLNTPRESEAGAPGPLDTARERAQAGPLGSDGAPEPLAVPGPGEAPPTLDMRVVRPPGILVTIEGLRRSSQGDVWVYECQPGDTWDSLAQRYYGSAARAELLRRYNEDKRRPEQSTLILVPTLDPADVARDDGPAEPRPQRRPEPAPAPMRTHTVVRGDSLWEISKQYYGTGTRWQELLEANRKVLVDPSRLDEGMVLAVPK